MNVETRTYQQRKRAANAEATRLRIVEAAVALHEELGPAQTSILAIAELANVGRPTVYRHFPDERSLFAACTGHYFGRHAPPQPSHWREVPGARARLAVGLSEIYAWYRKTERMLTKAFRDLPDLPALGKVMTPFFTRHAEMQAALLEPWPEKKSKQLQAAIGLALDFQTWRTLAMQGGLADRQILELMTGMVEAAGKSVRTRARGGS